jgi:hypothetical protein
MNARGTRPDILFPKMFTKVRMKLNVSRSLFVFKVVVHFDALNSPQFVKDLVRYIPSVLGRKECYKA